MIKNKDVNVIITAAGHGSRMKLKTSKQYLKIGAKTVLERTVSKFAHSPYVDRIYIVARREDFDLIDKEIRPKFPACEINLTEGGSTRAESTYKALGQIKDPQSCYVVTHDAARPFVSREMVDRIIEKLAEEEAIIYAVREIDSLKEVKDSRVVRSLDRSGIYRVQTPQAFATSLLLEGMEKFMGLEGLTDDSSFVDLLGASIYVLEGDYNNIKITTQEDLVLARALAEEEDNADR